jgi:hypothetical protein
MYETTIEDINLAHEVNEYLSTRGFLFLSVTENINSDKTVITWTIYKDKQEIGKFSTVNQPCRILIQTVANTAINAYIDSQKPKSWIEECCDIICPHCGYEFSDEIRLMGHGKELPLNFCPVCGKEIDDSKG